MTAEKTHLGQSYVAGASVVGAAGSISVATLISRILGVGREIILAKYFGAGLATDAFNVAYRIPNLLRDLFAEGALSSAFIPTFIRSLTNNGKEQAWLLANRVINVLLLITGALTLIFFFAAKWFVYLMAAGYAAIPEKLDLTVQMTRIMSPFLMWIALAAVGMGMLNACGSFFVPAMASSAFNICCILAGIFLSPLMPYWGLQPIVSMAIGALVGGISQFAVQMPAAYSFGFRYRFVFGFSSPELHHLARLMLPAIVGLSATQINIMVDYQLASLYGNGPVSWLNYGFRLMQFPIGVFGVAIATAALPTISYYAAQKATNKLRHTVDSSLRLTACLTIPATAGLIIFREEIARLLYQRGSFLPEDTLRTSQVLLLYALGLFSYSAVKILVPTFYALNDTRTPVRISMITIGVKIVINFLLIIPFGFLGLALATTIASWLNFGMLLKKLGRQADGEWSRRNLGSYLRIILVSLIMGFLAWIAFQAGLRILWAPTTVSLALRLFLAILVALVSLIPLLRLFKVEEASEIIYLIRLVLKKIR